MTMTTEPAADPLDEIAAEVNAARAERTGQPAPTFVAEPGEIEPDSVAAPSMELAEVDATDAVLSVLPTENEFRNLAVQARTLAASNLVPGALRNKPADVLLVLMTGRDLGIAPTAALRKCYVVDGQVTIAPALKIALLRIKGLGMVRPAADNDEKHATAIVYDQHSVELARVTVTMEQMQRVKYGKNRQFNLTEKDNWKNYPHRMLWWRAATQAVDDFFPEVAFGIYCPEEIGALTDEEGEVIELDSVEVPTGYESRGPRQSTEPEKITDDESTTLRNRASALPTEAKEELRGWARGRDSHLRFSDFTLGQAKVTAAFLVTLEKRATGGEWGSWVNPATGEASTTVDTGDDGITDAIVLCDTCGEETCVCDQSAEEMAAAEPEPDRMDSASVAMMAKLPLEGLINLGLEELRAACRGAHVAFDDDCDAEDLATLFKDAVEPF